MKRRQYLATIGTTVSALALAGCSSESENFEGGSDGSSGDGSSGDGSSSDDTSGDGSGGSSKDIELLSHQMVRENAGEMSESLSVEGTAKNVSGGELSYAEVEVKFYEGDTLAESFLDNISGWGAGERWAFEAMFPGMGDDATEITDYKIRAGTSL